MSNYDVDEEIEAFFAKTTATREACHQFAQTLGGAVVPVTIQGVCSYTVYAGPQSENVVQFRLKSLALSLDTVSLARSVYGDLAPDVHYRGQLGDDEMHDPNLRKEPLLIYVMDRVTGITYLDFILAHGGETPLASTQFAQYRLNLSKSVARFFALSWNSPQKLDEEKRTAMQAKQKRELEMLQAELPDRFQPFVQQSLDALPNIYDTLPTVLAHKDFGEFNVIVNETTGDLSGVVDWAEADIEPFGLNLHSFQRFLGQVHFKNGWSRYDDYQATEKAFWETFSAEAGLVDEHVIKTIKAARIVGLLLSVGFTSRLANVNPVPIQDDEAGAYNLRDLDGLLIDPPTRFLDIE